MKTSYSSLLVMLALLLPALLIGLGERPLYKIQEVRIAETAREMVVSGDWLVPRYNGELRLQKPPLPYWLTAASYRLFGVNETATRLPAVLFGLLSAFLLTLWSMPRLGARAATNAGLVLVVSFIGLRYFRSGEADAILLFFIAAACFVGYDLLERGGEARRRMLFGLLLGLGFLSKGPAALAIPLLTLLSWSLLQRRGAGVRQFLQNCFSLPGLVLLLIVAFGWYAWLLATLPDAAQYFIGRQVDETFVSGTHAKPLWWYPQHFFEFFAPWGILLLPAGWWAHRQRGQGSLPPVIRFAWLWLAVVFVLLSFTVNKQMQYALLFAPPLSLILGHYLAEAGGGFVRFNCILFWLFCVAALAAMGYLVFKNKSAALEFLPWLALLALPLVSYRLLNTRVLSFPVLLVAVVSAALYLYGEANLSKEPHKTAAKTLAAQLPGPEVPLYQDRPNDAKPGDGAISFYAGRVIPPVAAKDLPALLEQRGEIWLITEQPPALEGIDVELVTSVDELNLCRLRRKP